MTQCIRRGLPHTWEALRTHSMCRDDITLPWSLQSALLQSWSPVQACTTTQSTTAARNRAAWRTFLLIRAPLIGARFMYIVGFPISFGGPLRHNILRNQHTIGKEGRCCCTCAQNQGSHSSFRNHPLGGCTWALPSTDGSQLYR